MWRHTIIENLQSPNVNFFLCRQCRTHIALTHELVYRDTPARLGIFENIVNVQVDGPSHYQREGDNTGSDVHCGRCNSHLGWELIEVAEDNDVLNLGRFILLLSKLLMWDGTRILYADTNEPVGNA